MGDLADFSLYYCFLKESFQPFLIFHQDLDHLPKGPTYSQMGFISIKEKLNLPRDFTKSQFKDLYQSVSRILNKKMI